MNSDYVDYLKDELSIRKSFNPSYSLRAFARDLEIAPSTLSEVLARKHHLSIRTATKLVEKLKIDDEQRQNFLDLVALESPQKEVEQKKIAARIKARFETLNEKMPLDLFKVISGWEHFAILELTKVKGFNPSVSWVAECLGLSEDVIEEAIERLVQIDALLVEENQWSVNEKYGDNFVGYDIPSEAIKKFHQQCMQQILGKIRLPIEVREYSSTLMSIDRSEYEAIKKIMKKFKSEAIAQVSGQPKKDELYLLGIQFVPLSHNFEEQ